MRTAGGLSQFRGAFGSGEQLAFTPGEQRGFAPGP